MGHWRGPHCPGLGVCLLCRPACKDLPGACLSHWLQPGLCLCSGAAQVAKKWTFVWLISALFSDRLSTQEASSLGPPGGLGSVVRVCGKEEAPLLSALRHPLSLLGQGCAG